jgi:probable HAF family extracellular repeat protein
MAEPGGSFPGPRRRDHEAIMNNSLRARQMKSFFLKMFLLVICGVWLGAAAAAHAQTYKVTVLPELPGGGGFVNAINNQGQIVGGSIAADGHIHAAYWARNAGGAWEVTDIGTLGGLASRALGLNDGGFVVGFSFLTDGVTQRAFLWDPAGRHLTDLGGLAGTLSSARSINIHGQIVGTSTANPGPPRLDHATLWVLGSPPQDLDPGSTMASDAFGINDSGQVVGRAQVPSGTGVATHAMLWENGTRTDIAPDGSAAVAINNNGEVIGSMLQGPFIWDKFQGLRPLLDLSPPLSGLEFAYGINNKTLVVGEGRDNLTNPVAVLWDIPNNHVFNLNGKLNTSNPSLVLTVAVGINDQGWIVVQGALNGAGASFLLQPMTGARSLPGILDTILN